MFKILKFNVAITVSLKTPKLMYYRSADFIKHLWEFTFVVNCYFVGNIFVDPAYCVGVTQGSIYTEKMLYFH